MTNKQYFSTPCPRVMKDAMLQYRHFGFKVSKYLYAYQRSKYTVQSVDVQNICLNQPLLTKWRMLPESTATDSQRYLSRYSTKSWLNSLMATMRGGWMTSDLHYRWLLMLAGSRHRVWGQTHCDWHFWPRNMELNHARAAEIEIWSKLQTFNLKSPNPTMIC